MEIERLPLGQSLADKHRAAELKWRNMPPGLPPDMAAKFMAELRAGKTMRMLTNGGRVGPAMVTPQRFKRHCELNPKWGKEANKLAKINAKAADARKSPKLYRHLCKYGHPLAKGRIYSRYGYECRRCLECDKLRNARAGIISSEAIAKASIALRNGATVKQVLLGVTITPAGRRKRVINTPAFYRLRRENVDFDRLVRDAIEQRICSTNPVLDVAAGTFRYEWNSSDYQLIRGMLPENFPDKDVVINEVVMSLLEGRLDRSQIRAKIHWYLKAQNRIFPTKYRTLGNGLLLSLDEQLFDDGSGTIGDTVSRGLWD
jgi:hypothetical protein